MISVLAEPPRYSDGRSMRAIETSPAASLNVGEQVALVGRAQWETNWTALHMRSVQAWRAHHQQPWQPVRKIWVIRLSGDRSPQAPSLIKA